MYDLPGRTDVGKVVIDEDTVREKVEPDARAARGEPRQPPAPRRQLSYSLRSPATQAVDGRSLAGARSLAAADGFPRA